MGSILSSIFGNNKSSFSNLNAGEFQKLLNEKSNAELIDVRTKEEYDAVRIPKSKLIDIYQPMFLEMIDKLDRSKNYFVYCRSGSRSYSACAQMKKMGFENLYNLSGGINEWEGEVEQG